MDNIPLPPAAVFAACRDAEGHAITPANQAAAAGISLRQLYRLLSDRLWDHWRVGEARRWCAVCGFATTFAPKADPAVLRRAIADTESPRVLRALKDTLASLGQPCDRKAVRRLADAISELE